MRDLDHPTDVTQLRSAATANWLWSGTLASVLSAIVLAWHGRRRHGSSVSLLNAPSHWLHGERALRANMPSWRFTFWGLVIHHLSSLWWAALHEGLTRWASRPTRGAVPAACPPSAGASAEIEPHLLPSRDVARPVALAAAVTVLAWFVDTRAVPPRLRPGFERRATRTGIAWVYGAFGAGLLIAGLGRGHRQIPASAGKTCATAAASGSHEAHRG